jgi:hypothetical protein
MVMRDDATEEQFAETQDWLDAVDWEITQTITGMNSDGAQVVELSAAPSGILTVEALSGADEQLAELAKLL